MSHYTKQELANMLGNGVISKAEMQLLAVSEELAKEIQTRVEKQASSTDKDLIEKCASSDVAIASTAAHEYSDRVQREQVSIRKQASRDIEDCVNQFESIQRKMVRKAGQTRQQQESEIWAANPELFDKYLTAQRILLTPETR